MILTNTNDLIKYSKHLIPNVLQLNRGFSCTLYILGKTNTIFLKVKQSTRTSIIKLNIFIVLYL